MHHTVVITFARTHLSQLASVQQEEARAALPQALLLHGLAWNATDTIANLLMNIVRSAWFKLAGNRAVVFGAQDDQQELSDTPKPTYTFTCAHFSYAC